MPLSCSSQLGDGHGVAQVLRCWQAEGQQSARQLWADLRPRQRVLLPLEQELDHRLAGASGPRLLLDGLWFCRPLGGIGRVWQQLLGCWSLPGLVTPQAPVCLIDRDSHLALTSRFERIAAQAADPLEIAAVAALSSGNAHLARQWRADVFLSSWISVCDDTPCADFPELALVHDCIPERSDVPEDLARQRRRWLLGSSGQMAVSSATASDLEQLCQRPQGSVPWCHPAADAQFAATVSTPGAERLWQATRTRLGIRPPFVLLPATSRVGSYKNPELVGAAVVALPDLQLVLCGNGANLAREGLLEAFPSLTDRCLSVTFSEPELAVAYRQACAVVIPSRVEGFGLPALEAAAAGGMVIVADSRGLREAAGEAGLRVDVDQPAQLQLLLQTLQDPDARSWWEQRLCAKRRQRLQRNSSELLGLALLAAARALAARSGRVTS